MADGLLDFLKTPEGQGLLSGVFGYAANARSGTPWNNIGRGGVAGLMGYGNALERQDTLAQREQQKKMQDAQLNLSNLQLSEMNRKIELDKQMREMAKRYLTPATAATTIDGQVPANVAGDTGPNLFSSSLSNMTVPGKVDVPAKPSSYNYEGYLNELSTVDPLRAIEERAKLLPDPKYHVVGNNLVAADRTGAKPVFTAPEKPPEATGDMKNYQFGLKDPGFNTWLTSQATAKAPKVAVDMTGGQAGFNNEMKLLDSFKGEPIYKTHSEVSDAHRQIKSALAQGTPISDTAAATKIMKLLDPGSVVRESELGMAMAAAGRMDRLKYYLTNFKDGTKLTPTQRTDFSNLADELTAASAQAYNSTRQSYIDRGKGYKLDAERALGPAAKVPSIMGGSSNKQVFDRADAILGGG